MILRTISTGSKGNCYLLTDSENNTLILDCGVKHTEIFKALNYNPSGIVGACVSHEHGDHNKCTKSLEGFGVDICKPFDDKKTKHLFGKFRVQAFELVHDVPCFGFYITHPEMGKMLYITDTEYCKYRFKDINHILIECNYDERLIPDDHPAFEHIKRGHMELQTVKEFIEVNDNANLKNIIICHTSNENIDRDVIEEEMFIDDRFKFAIPGKEVDFTI